MKTQLLIERVRDDADCYTIRYSLIGSLLRGWPEIEAVWLVVAVLVGVGKGRGFAVRIGLWVDAVESLFASQIFLFRPFGPLANLCTIFDLNFESRTPSNMIPEWSYFIEIPDR